MKSNQLNLKKSKMTLRFNLGRGKNFMKWKITTTTKEKIYLEPNDVILQLINCKLYNDKTQSTKIFEGGHKRVCSWIECDDILVNPPKDITYGERIHYNPRNVPYWTNDNGDYLDGMEFEKLVTYNNSIFWIFKI